jgi:hypothetical protein
MLKKKGVFTWSHFVRLPEVYTPTGVLRQGQTPVSVVSVVLGSVKWQKQKNTFSLFFFEPFSVLSNLLFVSVAIAFL